MSVKLLTKHHLEFLSLKGGCIGSSEFTLVKMPHCWKSHVAAHIHTTINNNKGSSNDKFKKLLTRTVYFSMYSSQLDFM